MVFVKKLENRYEKSAKKMKILKESDPESIRMHCNRNLMSDPKGTFLLCKHCGKYRTHMPSNWKLVSGASMSTSMFCERKDKCEI